MKVKIVNKTGVIKDTKIYNEDGKEIRGCRHALVEFDIERGIVIADLEFVMPQIMTMANVNSAIQHYPLNRRGLLGRLAGFTNIVYLHYQSFRHNINKADALWLSLKLGFNFLEGVK